MAFGLRITDGTNTLFDCTASGRWISKLNGWQRGQPTDDGSVMDTFIMMVKDVIADIQADASSINRIALLAEEYEDNQIGDRIYLEATLDGTNWKRSPMVGGAVDGYNLDSAIMAGYAEMTFRIERKDYFEPLAETTLPLTNPNGSNITNGIKIYNCNDGAVVDTIYHRHNYVEVAAADVLGDLPAPVKLRITSGNAFNRVYAGVGWANDQALNTLLEAEATMGGTDDATCSGGHYCRTAENFVAILTGGAAKPNFYLPVMRARISGANAKLSYQITYGQPHEVYLNRLAGASDFQLYPLDILRAPAAGPGMGIEFQWHYAAIQDTDFVQLLPANFWRIAERVGDDPVATEYLEDGYTERAGFMHTIEQPTLASGTGIFLQPGKTQRLWILRQNLISEGGGTAEIGIQATVTLTYRPRFRNL